MSVEVQQTSNASSLPSNTSIGHWVTQALARSAPESLRGGDVCIRVVDLAEGRALNQEYRGKNQATNVLSFPLIDLAVGSPDAGPADGPVPKLLGDIVLCAPIVEQEASEQGKTVSDHTAHLVIHGVLHLLGYDHQTDTEAQAMESLETRLLADFGIADPYVVQPARACS